MKVYEFNVKTKLPDALKPLEDIAHNLWYSWNWEARELFRMISYDLWEECGHNPVWVISKLTEKDFGRLTSDPVFMNFMDTVHERLKEYKDLPKWFDLAHSGKRAEDMCVAYFSAEYGIHESVKLYSGGLGVLSGDHCKSASDLGIPFIAVGLLYRNGYFHQYLNTDGWQQQSVPYNEFHRMPLRQVTDAEGEPLIVNVKLGSRNVSVKVWEMTVGVIQLYLMDTDVITNDIEDRKITGQLYGGDSDMRLKQEIILGIAGARALLAMGKKPTVYHLNEGHPSFCALERIRQYVHDGVSLKKAAEIVKKSTLFTTHTPVPAGFDVFSTDQINRFLGPIFAETGFNINQLMGFGRENPFDEHEGFAMAICGIRLSTFRNGVSKLHGQVSREMFRKLWNNALEEYVPIDHVTNGVHLPTFIAENFKTLYTRYMSEAWLHKPYDFSVWNDIEKIPDSALFEAKEKQRDRLVMFARERLKKHVIKSGGTASEITKADDVLRSDCLTIGFARRFATYKRGYLLFMDEERLEKILNDPERPVQILIAGKAHPKDDGGKEIIKKIFHICRKPQFRDKIVFIEDYDIEVARHLAHGVDIWLNTPRRPMEASGTSGMKIAANGGLNFSILDGWWDEGYNGETGFAIGSGEQYDKEEYQDYIESMEIYDKLENEIVPLFYNRDRMGVPREWMHMMKQAVKVCAAFFNTSRMVMEYTDKFYIPLHNLYKDISVDNFAPIDEYLEWKDSVISGWDNSGFSYTNVQGDSMEMGSDVVFEASIVSPKIDHTHLNVYAVVDFDGESGVLKDPDFVKLSHVDDSNGGHYYKTTYKIGRAGKMKVGFAVLPSHDFVKNIFELNLVKWA
ncbi:alpha-glucan phosphorylase [Denitrovibrio acetiphilus DSM 12809]|uniref:Alpha-glucan phosphorylase n=1 Tax=Denitrovibrio acetiphilus (strain DSM 12809 / NBRC 114555 / N2460) TaxID=522772 RepID=D4H7X6_DENA2|nr:alpha-glucan family phosphorylase [Denitrovibrio acetiphilus]ADD68125.1 alpha-glucan phosphorylase [Denitrovibrio acetiphilus DSM 12809]